MKSTVHYFLCCILALNIVSCKHKNFGEFVGPALCPSDNFKLNSFTISYEQIDFNSTGYSTISVSFSEEVTWNLVLTGQKSGATKVCKGRSSQFEINWYGQSSSSDKFFESGETVKVELSISCLSETYTKSIDIIQANRFTKQDGTYLLVSDFEGNGCVQNATKINGYLNGSWCSYWSSPGSITSYDIHSNNAMLNSPQGSTYITMTGKAGASDWYTGGAYVELPSTFSISTSNNAYLSAFISSGNNTSTTLGITFKVKGIPFQYILPINWSGWKMVQLKLSDFKNSNGDLLTQIDGITSLDFSANCASRQGQETEMNLDFVVISKDGPFFQ